MPYGYKAPSLKKIKLIAHHVIDSLHAPAHLNTEQVIEPLPCLTCHDPKINCLTPALADHYSKAFDFKSIGGLYALPVQLAFQKSHQYRLCFYIGTMFLRGR